MVSDMDFVQGSYSATEQKSTGNFSRSIRLLKNSPWQENFTRASIGCQRDLVQEDWCASTLRALYITQVRPHLEYAIPVWNGQSFFVNPPLSYFSSVYNTRSHELTLNIPFTQSTSSFNSFFCDTARLWNHLPYEIVSTPTFIPFKKAVSKYLLNS